MNKRQKTSKEINKTLIKCSNPAFVGTSYGAQQESGGDLFIPNILHNTEAV